MLTSHQDGGIVHITIDSPPLNLVDGEFVRDLLRLLPDLEQDESIKVVIFRSADADFFLMHGDVRMMAEAPVAEYQPATRPNIAASTFLRISRAPFVSIGAIDGAARGGGCEFLSALDIRIGTPRVVIGQPEVPLGILPGAGGTVRWPRIAGRAAALELMLTARDIHAAEALSLGWLQRIVPTDRVYAEADILARRIAQMPRMGIAAIKRVVDLSLTGIEDSLIAENDALAQMMASGAHIQPMRRFLVAGGQTREGERADITPVIDAVLREQAGQV